jgi:hypothetical protein
VLRVQQMARGIVGHPCCERAAGRRAPLREQLRDVAHPVRESRGVGIIRQEPAVRLEQGAASGAVHGDGRIRISEGLDIPAGERLCILVQSGVGVQRAAAHLARG